MMTCMYVHTLNHTTTKQYTIPGTFYVHTACVLQISIIATTTDTTIVIIITITITTIVMVVLIIIVSININQ